MDRYTIQNEKYSLEDIKRDYYLYNLCVADTPQLENIAITIQSLYFYKDILVSNTYPKTIEASLCRTIVIMSYSILEAIVVSLGYKLQYTCLNCSSATSCDYYSYSMFAEDQKSNELNAFKNADKYLTEIGIISFTSSARRFYDEFRNIRNNVHLTRNTKVIHNEKQYTREHCNLIITFFQEFIDMLNHNYLDFIKKHHC
jgi:hypothetical protein